ncbi:MAG: hypothetical protein LBR55_01865, partial [Bacteroidales bacterium]|nr:hypothetical protein [Bacteroidales bacterium]
PIDSVGKIAITFPHRSAWHLLQDDYFSLKKMLTKKYGKSTKYVEMLHTNRDRNNPENFTYSATFESENEYIDLSILNTGGKVMLAYYNKNYTEITAPKSEIDNARKVGIVGILSFAITILILGFLIYTITAGMNRIIRKYPDRKFHLQCEKCGNITEHGAEDFIRFRRKLKNTNGFTRTVSLFQQPCEKCGKTANMKILDNPWRRDLWIWLAKALGIICALSFLEIIVINLIEK